MTYFQLWYNMALDEYAIEWVSEWSGLMSFISSLELCTTVVVRSDVTGPDSSRGLICQHNEVPCHR